MKLKGMRWFSFKYCDEYFTVVIKHFRLLLIVWEKGRHTQA